jgi:hypothetical protein
MGTSLKVAGIRAAVKSLAKTILASEGVVVLINDRPLGKEWEGVFTHWIRGKCDAICSDLQRCMDELKTSSRLRPATPGKALSSPSSKASSMVKVVTSKASSSVSSVKAPTKVSATTKTASAPLPAKKTVSKALPAKAIVKKTAEKKDTVSKSPLLPIKDTQKLVTGLLRQSKTTAGAAKDKPKPIPVLAKEPRAAAAKTRRPVAPL